MLKLLRSKKIAKKIWIILAILIIPAFCLWGFGSALRTREKPIFLGRVSGKSISIQEYVRNFKAIRNQYLIQLGEEQLAKLEKYLNLETQAWDRIVLLAEAKQKRIRVSNREVVDSIKQYPFFKREDVFDPQLYQEMITYVFRTNPRTFEEEIRDNLIILKLYQEVTKGITVRDEEIKDAYEEVNQQISLDYILAQLRDFSNQVLVEKQELIDYYNKNPKAFMKPLSYNLEYIRIGNNDKEIINKIIQLINQGSSLQDVAKNSGLEVKETGLFSNNEPIPQIGWSTEILKILSKLKPKGEVWPQPIQTDADVAYFVRLKEKKEPHIPPLDDIRDEVNQRLRQQKASKIAKERLESCRDQIEALGFSEAAKKFNLKTGKTELFKRRGYVEGLGSSDILFEATQNLKENQISQIISIPSGFCMVKLKEQIKPDEKEFEQEKQNFADNLLQGKKQDYFRQFLTELKNKPDTFILATEPLSRNP